MGCSPWGREESDMTERLHFHFPLLCIGEGNGSPLQCSCLENPRDGVAQSRIRLKLLSSSSSSQCRRCKRRAFDPWVRKSPWRKAWQPAPVCLPGESHGQRSLAGSENQTGLKQLSWQPRLLRRLPRQGSRTALSPDPHPPPLPPSDFGDRKDK